MQTAENHRTEYLSAIITFYWMITYKYTNIGSTLKYAEELAQDRWMRRTKEMFRYFLHKRKKRINILMYTYRLSIWWMCWADISYHNIVQSYQSNRQSSISVRSWIEKLSIIFYVSFEMHESFFHWTKRLHFKFIKSYRQTFCSQSYIIIVMFTNCR